MSAFSDAVGDPVSGSSAPPDVPVALRRYRVLAPHLDEGVTLKATAEVAGVPYRTVQRWLAAYRRGGLEALSRAPHPGKGRRKFPAGLIT